MRVSILIISKDRKTELDYTLQVLERIVDLSNNEVLVFLDGCTDESLLLTDKFKWVKWYSSENSLGASSARKHLYPKAQGQFLIGLDDDAHPLHSDFIHQTTTVFAKYPNVGIVAFHEIKGIYNSDLDALTNNAVDEEEYLCSEFIGCGFAIRKSVYDATNGFPAWVDIYGEESCVSMEVMAIGYDIVYSNKIKVNHRVDKEARKRSGMNYFRFGKQLKNVTYYYIVYYPNPLLKILKLYRHNLMKYALTDRVCFKIFFKIICEVLINLPKILKYRKPIDNTLLKKMNNLSAIRY